MHDVDRRLIELTAEWMGLIGSDHHKDRDCHFYIQKRWSYGEPPVYQAQHYGYIVEELESPQFLTYGRAARWLISRLAAMIDEERQHTNIERG